jgi:uncharacterized membrane protein YdjX (TVP38/TMEM64 family)
LILFILMIGVVAALSVAMWPLVKSLGTNPEQFILRSSNYIRSFGFWGILIYLLLQILHVIIVVIPGEIIQMVGGYIYGTALGALYTELGMMLGVMIVFSAVRLLGYGAVEQFIPARTLEKYRYLITHKRSEIILFAMLLIPGFPKDTITYLAGLTPIKPVRFFILSAVARFPGILGSSYMGARLGSGDYLTILVVAAVAAVLFIAGVYFQKDIVTWIQAMKRKKGKRRR